LLAFWVTLAVSLVLSGLIFLGAPFLATLFDKPFMAAVFRAFSVSVPFWTVMSTALWATQGFQTVKYTTYAQLILQPLINLVLIVTFYLFGARILGAVAAYILSLAGGTALALYYLKRVFPKLLDRNTPPKFEARGLFGTSAPMLVANLARTMNFWAPVTVLGIFSSAAAVGVYNAAARTAVFCSLVLMAFTGIFSPMVSSLYSRSLLTDLGQLYKDVCRWVLTGSLAVVLLTVLLAKDILVIFGPEFVAGWVVLVIIASSELFDNSAGPADRLLAMTGHQRIVMLATLGYAGVGVAASFALVPIYGMVGAAVATSAATIVLNATMLLAVRRILGFSPYDYRSLKPVVAGLLATIVTLSVRFVLQLPNGLSAMLILTIPFLVSFAAVLLAFGLSSSDRQLLEVFWRAFR
jgi:O-antigen/teichoic acid export membrane protein